jgi:nickel transport protein
VSLSYAGGRPFAFEAYELYAGDAEAPYQVGRTDTRGRLTFLADGHASWRLRAFTEDGHGVDTAFEVTPKAVSDAPASRLAPGILGVSLVLALFGLYQLVLRKRR